MAEQKVECTKGLGCELPGGAKVDGYLRSDSSIDWVFRSEKGMVTRILLSLDALSAMEQIADALINPKEPAA